MPQGEGQGHLSQKKTVTIPSGSILAFRVAQLVIDSDLGELELGMSRAQALAEKQGGLGRATRQLGLPWAPG